VQLEAHERKHGCGKRLVRNDAESSTPEDIDYWVISRFTATCFETPELTPDA
jgi:hypothetical protein